MIRKYFYEAKIKMLFLLTLKACEDNVEVPECDDGQKAKIYHGSECADLNDGDEFPEKKDLKDNNPCEGLEEVSSKLV